MAFICVYLRTKTEIQINAMSTLDTSAGLASSGVEALIERLREDGVASGQSGG